MKPPKQMAINTVKAEITISRTTKPSFEDETAFLSEQYVINLLYVGST